MKRFGIDISYCQENVNYDEVCKYINFAILRAGVTGSIDGIQKDSMFEKHYREFSKRGIDLGAYYYSKATTITEAKAEAQAFVSYLKGKQFTYPIYMDVESDKQAALSPKVLTDVVIAFGEEVERLGYYFGIYSSLSWFQSKLEDERLSRFDKWVAQWDVQECTYPGSYGMWQFIVAGLKGVGTVDQNYCYKDYPSLIRSNRLNHLQTSSSSSIGNASDARARVVKAMQGFIGKDGKEIIKGYNAVRRQGAYPLPLNGAWCAATVSLAFAWAGFDHLILKDAYCPYMMDDFKKRGQLKGRTYRPLPGDVVFYDWDDNNVPNHVGIVERVDDNIVTAIEGNKSDRCERRQFNVGWGLVLGYGVPAYPVAQKTQAVSTAKASNVSLNGIYRVLEPKGLTLYFQPNSKSTSIGRMPKNFDFTVVATSTDATGALWFKLQGSSMWCKVKEPNGAMKVVKRK